MIRPRVKACLFLALGLSLLAAPPSSAFFEETHADISQAAFHQSSVATVLQDLDIDSEKPFSAGHLSGSLPPVEWVRKGSKDEDSWNGLRFFSHFYDPTFNRGLTLYGIKMGAPAPDWGLEDRGEVTDPYSGYGPAIQDYSYKDARELFLLALTAPAPGDREAALAQTFERLGHVIHVLQEKGTLLTNRTNSFLCQGGPAHRAAAAGAHLPRVAVAHAEESPVPLA